MSRSDTVSQAVQRETVAAAQSMTGYGRGSRRGSLAAVTVDVRSTNHRYLEIDARLPNGLSGFQERIVELFREHLRRGRIEVNVAVRADRANRWVVRFDEQLLQRYHEALVALKGRFAVKGAITLEHLLALPQAMTVAEEKVQGDHLWEMVQHAARTALKELVQARRREGARLIVDLRRQLRAIERRALSGSDAGCAIASASSPVPARLGRGPSWNNRPRRWRRIRMCTKSWCVWKVTLRI
jgi:uncharacterized protein (TIGR00255 family)